MYLYAVRMPIEYAVAFTNKQHVARSYMKCHLQNKNKEIGKNTRHFDICDALPFLTVHRHTHTQI